MNRDLFHYFHDFGNDGANAHQSSWLRSLFFKLILWAIFLFFASWFAFESYHGLMIYDG